MIKLKINLAAILIFLFTMVWLACSQTHIETVGAADKENQTLCKPCHSKLTEILPKGHQYVEDFDPPFCIKCHDAPDSVKTFDWLIHFKHYSVADIEINCEDCHRFGEKNNLGTPGKEPQQKILLPGMAGKWEPYFKTWATSGYMDNAHAQNGMTCNPCHGAPPTFETPTLEKCLECHKKYIDPPVQKNNGAPNPHQSHLESPPCIFCHKAHEESVNFCNNDNCHNFNFKFPYPNTK
jgi:hypothetical protein